MWLSLGCSVAQLGCNVAQLVACRLAVRQPEFESRLGQCLTVGTSYGGSAHWADSREDMEMGLSECLWMNDVWMHLQYKQKPMQTEWHSATKPLKICRNMFCISKPHLFAVVGSASWLARCRRRALAAAWLGNGLSPCSPRPTRPLPTSTASPTSSTTGTTFVRWVHGEIKMRSTRQRLAGIFSCYNII